MESDDHSRIIRRDGVDSVDEGAPIRDIGDHTLKNKFVPENGARNQSPPAIV